MTQEELDKKQASFEELLTREELIIINGFKMPTKIKDADIKNYITSKVDGWQLIQNTDKTFAVKLMLGYKTKSLPRLTQSVKIKDWDEVQEFKQYMDNIIKKARQDIDELNGKSLLNRLKGADSES